MRRVRNFFVGLLWRRDGSADVLNVGIFFAFIMAHFFVNEGDRVDTHQSILIFALLIEIYRLREKTGND